ncbi:MAG TPA: vanadium-dependent haloperoxidase [Puia sp.]|nr:vanadium-dependent haloperoxidase [Puia sp.]
MIKFNYLLFISAALLCGVQGGWAQAQHDDAKMAERCIRALTDVMVHDITSPPVAGRDYVYSLIAFYEAARAADTTYKTFAGLLTDLQPLPRPVPCVQYDWLVAGATAFYKTGYAFAFSKDLFQRSWDTIAAELRRRAFSPEVYDRSVVFGEQVSGHILKWSRGDNYLRTRGMQRYTVSKTPGAWQQTGPDYMEALEPHWDQMRPMTMAKAHQFVIPEPAAFGSAKFVEEYKDVYETTLKMTAEQTDIAKFWDCNPFATQTVGHLMYSVKKISPGGHWVEITGLAIRQKNLMLVPALYTYGMVSVAIFDAILGAWDEKYRSNYIRPITAIQQTIAPTWQPVLQTPPFPEYPSGHSVISMASATVLTGLYGDDFHYVDSVEKPYGLPERPFRSFFEAANEAAISRLYGGIHFREAIDNGKDLGKTIGSNVLERLKGAGPGGL